MLQFFISVNNPLHFFLVDGGRPGPLPQTEAGGPEAGPPAAGHPRHPRGREAERVRDAGGQPAGGSRLHHRLLRGHCGPGAAGGRAAPGSHTAHTEAQPLRPLQPDGGTQGGPAPWTTRLWKDHDRQSHSKVNVLV